MNVGDILYRYEFTSWGSIRLYEYKVEEITTKGVWMRIHNVDGYPARPVDSFQEHWSKVKNGSTRRASPTKAMAADALRRRLNAWGLHIQRSLDTLHQRQSVMANFTPEE